MNRYRDIDPGDIDPDTGRPYSNYSSPSLDTSFHDHEMDVDDDALASSFTLGQAILLPNGVESTVCGIDTLDNEIMDHTGGWHAAGEVEVLS